MFGHFPSTLSLLRLATKELLRLAKKDLVEQRRKRELERLFNHSWKRRSKIIRRCTVGRPVAEEEYSVAKFTKEESHLQAETKVFMSQSQGPNHSLYFSK